MFPLTWRLRSVADLTEWIANTGRKPCSQLVYTWIDAPERNRVCYLPSNLTAHISGGQLFEMEICIYMEPRNT